MKQLTLLAHLLLTAGLAYSQAPTVQILTSLSSELEETSGLLNLDGHIFTHNDSGSDAKLYELDTITGSVLRTIVVANAVNTDWEDLAADDNYVYIGDIGNNAGDRTDLKVLRVSRASLLANDTISADSILYDYSDQTDFTPATFANDYDAEALMVLGDSLAIFSKNWVNQKTRWYTLPKTPGTYTAQLRDSLDVGGLITAADINPTSGRIAFSATR